jgi:hypothetical protein
MGTMRIWCRQRALGVFGLSGRYLVTRRVLIPICLSTVVGDEPEGTTRERVTSATLAVIQLLVMIIRIKKKRISKKKKRLEKSRILLFL